MTWPNLLSMTVLLWAQEQDQNDKGYRDIGDSCMCLGVCALEGQIVGDQANEHWPESLNKIQAAPSLFN